MPRSLTRLAGRFLTSEGVVRGHMAKQDRPRYGRFGKAGAPAPPRRHLYAPSWETAELLQHGKAMRKGRKPGAVGTVRKRIRALLAKDAARENLELWELLKARPPKGWEFIDHGELRERWFLDYPGGSMSWRRFCNACAEERARLR